MVNIFSAVFFPHHYSNFGLNIFSFSRNLGKQVSWLRHVDTHLLTTGLYTYTKDRRFTAIHRENSEDWVLEISDTALSDEGKKHFIYLQCILLGVVE